MSATGDAVVLYKARRPAGPSPATARPAGRGAALQEVLKQQLPGHAEGLMVEFDGTGRTVALANFREFSDTIRVNVGTGGPGARPIRSSTTTGANPPNPSFDIRILQALVRHPQGAVAVWTRRSTSSNFDDDIVVSRLSGAGWETPQKIFDLPSRLRGRERGDQRRGRDPARGDAVDRQPDDVDRRSARRSRRR